MGVESGNLVILLGSLLLLSSILAGQMSEKVGAPVLLVFLAFGMIAGEDGPGGIRFDDVALSFVVGKCALAIILFDGGLRTPRTAIIAAWRPALALATAGVLITAGCVGAFVHYGLGLGWLQAFLIGSIVSSTDAAAVFALLGRGGVVLRDRLRALLELESGSNDPMAVFLTVLCLEMLQGSHGGLWWWVVRDFAAQLGLGLFLGVVGGATMAWLGNRLSLTGGLAAILVLSLALLAFSSTEAVGGSGYLAVYVTGLVYGNQRARGVRAVGRFFDGLAWLGQIVLFLLLGLLVSPHQLLPEIPEALAVAAVLILVARPLAVVVALSPFGFTRREQTFVAWVGLRGAVPIFLALFPLLAGIDTSRSFFNITFVVVLISLLIQGWTIPPVSRWLAVVLPPAPEAAQRFDVDLPRHIDRDLVAYTVKPRSRATDYGFGELELPARVGIAAVIRDGVSLRRDEIDRLRADDFVLVLTPSDQVAKVDRFFSRRFKSTAPLLRPEQGDFIVDGATLIDDLVKAYDITIKPHERSYSVARVLGDRLGTGAGRGDSVRFGAVQLFVVDIIGSEIRHVGIVLPSGDTESPSRPRSWWLRWRRG
ncbi:K(+)/H(+) antiporter NhaP2 [uncultured Gammaproteobacteria bacterium]